MDKISFPTNKCRISDDWAYKEMPVVYMENDFIKIGILVGRGSDIFEFSYKPRGIDLMLRLNKGIRNPNRDFSQIRDTPNQLEDYYYGGWQEALPNSPTFNYRGASLGQHGEVSLVPWKHAIVENSPSKVAVKLWVRPLRVPVYLEKTLSINNDNATLFIEERLVNESKTDLDIMWGHHIAFGLPFLKQGGEVITNATNFEAEPAMPDHRRFKGDYKGSWPLVKNINGEEDDASLIPAESGAAYSELAYLSGFPDKAFYGLWNANEELGFTAHWDASVFSHLWYWQERYATQDAPWWGSAYAVGLEPWTSKWTNDPEKAIANGEWLKLSAGQEKLSKMNAGIITAKPDL